MATAEQIDAMRQVQAEIRKLGTWTPDHLKYGEAEYWATYKELQDEIARNGGFKDDCDGFAALAMGLLKDRGIPARYVLCTVPQGGAHLVVEFDGWVVDSAQPTLNSRDDLEAIGYKFISRSGANPGDDWHTIS